MDRYGLVAWAHIESLRREAELARLANEARRSAPTAGWVRVRLAMWLMMAARRLWPEAAGVASRTWSQAGITR
jgi:hypothetical protein